MILAVRPVRHYILSYNIYGETVHEKGNNFFLLYFDNCYERCFPAAASYNDEIDLDAEIALLVSLDNGTVIFDKNAEKRTAPASPNQNYNRHRGH